MVAIPESRVSGGIGEATPAPVLKMNRKARKRAADKAPGLGISNVPEPIGVITCSGKDPIKTNKRVKFN